MEKGRRSAESAYQQTITGTGTELHKDSMRPYGGPRVNKMKEDVSPKTFGQFCKLQIF